ncbi:unnamed protein product [Allacma fusca]|uniref:Uncharacterized protein n=1 Tax=Allacma fusca TaxID=39272 RepID=A0A8J2L6P1_9HEXA|nr:unnamed protein product [Allacma fusca]
MHLTEHPRHLGVPMQTKHLNYSINWASSIVMLQQIHSLSFGSYCYMVNYISTKRKRARKDISDQLNNANVLGGSIPRQQGNRSWLGDYQQTGGWFTISIVQSSVGVVNLRNDKLGEEDSGRIGNGSVGLFCLCFILIAFMLFVTFRCSH